MAKGKFAAALKGAKKGLKSDSKLSVAASDATGGGGDAAAAAMAGILGGGAGKGHWKAAALTNKLAAGLGGKGGPAGPPPSTSGAGSAAARLMGAKKKGWKAAGVASKFGVSNFALPKAQHILEPEIQDIVQIPADPAMTKQQFEGMFNQKFELFTRRKEFLEEEMRQKHQQSFQDLKIKLESDEVDALASSQIVMGLRRKQQQLLQSKNYAAAFEHMKEIKRAEGEAIANHKAVMKVQNEKALKHLLDVQSDEREALKGAVDEAENRVRNFKFQRMTEMVWKAGDDLGGAGYGNNAAELLDGVTQTSGRPGDMDPYNPGQQQQQQHLPPLSEPPPGLHGSASVGSMGGMPGGSGMAQQQQHPQGRSASVAGYYPTQMEMQQANGMMPPQQQQMMMPPGLIPGMGLEQSMAMMYGGGLSDHPSPGPYGATWAGPQGSAQVASELAQNGMTSLQWGPPPAGPLGPYRDAFADSIARWSPPVHPAHGITPTPTGWMPNETSGGGGGDGGSEGDPPGKLKPLPAGWGGGDILNARPGAGRPITPAGGGDLHDAATALLSAASALLGGAMPDGSDLQAVLRRAGGGGSGGGSLAGSRRGSLGASREASPGPGSPGPEDGDPEGGEEAGGAGGGGKGLAGMRGKIKAGAMMGRKLVRMNAGRDDEHAEPADAAAAADDDDDGDDSDVPLVLPDSPHDGTLAGGHSSVPQINLGSLPGKFLSPADRLEAQRRQEHARALGKKAVGLGRRVVQQGRIFGMVKEDRAVRIAREAEEAEAAAAEAAAAEEEKKKKGPTEQQKAAASLFMRAAGGGGGGAGGGGGGGGGGLLARLGAARGGGGAPGPGAMVPSQDQASGELMHGAPQGHNPMAQFRSAAGMQMGAPGGNGNWDQMMAMQKVEQSQRAQQAGKRTFTTDDFKILFSYCRHGKYKLVTELLKSGCPVDGRDKFGNTPMMVACQNGHSRIVKACIRYGADVDKQNKNGNTGLHYCVAYGFNALGDYLIKKGASDQIRNQLGLTCYEGIK